MTRISKYKTKKKVRSAQTQEKKKQNRGGDVYPPACMCGVCICARDRIPPCL
uniref:Uncharacterized protein n=1 Tax=Human betaherpesvirus 6 TaxID=10368 RepID=A0A5P9TSH1_9BETA|nr:hypothetical protein [Human betaherpesvirus 6]QFW36638.1 hypothetical protein [Human betaherpesvirus 6]QFW36648.1 hypothetical protein [Human betaherpesvirus 6]